MTSFHQNRNYKFVNNKQSQATKACNVVSAYNLPMLCGLTTKLVNVYAYNFPMLGPLATNPCTLMYYNCRNLSTSAQEKKERKQVNNVEYWDGIKSKETRQG